MLNRKKHPSTILAPSSPRRRRRQPRALVVAHDVRRRERRVAAALRGHRLRDVRRRLRLHLARHGLQDRRLLRRNRVPRAPVPRKLRRHERRRRAARAPPGLPDLPGALLLHAVRPRRDDVPHELVPVVPRAVLRRRRDRGPGARPRRGRRARRGLLRGLQRVFRVSRGGGLRRLRAQRRPSASAEGARHGVRRVELHRLGPLVADALLRARRHARPRPPAANLRGPRARDHGRGPRDLLLRGPVLGMPPPEHARARRPGRSFPR